MQKALDGHQKGGNPQNVASYGFGLFGGVVNLREQVTCGKQQHCHNHANRHAESNEFSVGVNRFVEFACAEHFAQNYADGVSEGHICYVENVDDGA